MKKRIAVIFLFLLVMSAAVVMSAVKRQIKSESENIKLVELEKYSTMTIDGTTSIEVEYRYNDETYKFVIEDEKTIANIMTAIFDMKLRKYPDNADVCPAYDNELTVVQDDTDYPISLFNAYKGKQEYLCQSGAISKLLKKYIEANLIA